MRYKLGRGRKVPQIRRSHDSDQLLGLSLSPSHKIEIVLKLKQKNILASEVSSCECAILVVADDADILKCHQILVGPRRRKSHAGKEFPGIAVGVVNCRWSQTYGTPPPARARAEKYILFVVTPPLRIAAVHQVLVRT